MIEKTENHNMVNISSHITQVKIFETVSQMVDVSLRLGYNLQCVFHP